MQTPDDTTHDTDDFVENDVTEYEGKPLMAAAECPACLRVLPLEKFKRYLTPAEAKYRGYSGARKVIIETEKCENCRLRRRTKAEEFTNPELKRKAAKGYINPVTANAIIAVRQRRASSAMRGAVVKRWDAKRREEWVALIALVDEEIHAVRQQAKYAKTKKDRAEVLVYTKGYAEILIRVRADMRLEARKTTRSPEHTRWQPYVTPRERNIIAALWNDVPFKLRDAGMRKPMAFSFDDRMAPSVPTRPGAEEKGTVILLPQTSSAQPDGPEPADWVADL